VKKNKKVLLLIKLKECPPLEGVRGRKKLISLKTPPPCPLQRGIFIKLFFLNFSILSN